MSCPTWITIARNRNISDSVTSGTRKGPLSRKSKYRWYNRLLSSTNKVITAAKQTMKNYIKCSLYLCGATFCLLPVMAPVNDWMLLCLTCNFPTSISLRVQVGLVSTHHQKCHLCCHGHTQLNGGLQDFTCVVLSSADTEACWHYIIFLLSVLSQFSSVTSESLSSIGWILSLSKCCVWNSYMRMLWFLQYQRIDKKLKLHLGEFEIEQAAHLLRHSKPNGESQLKVIIWYAHSFILRTGTTV
jgi:hypothetical protein